MRTDSLDLLLDGVAQVYAIGAGTGETSHYPAIFSALNAAGESLSPKVLCLQHPTGTKAGIPDFGLFEQTSFRKGAAPSWQGGILPERGVVEAKGLGHDMGKLLASDQVLVKYLPTYGVVLCTNLRQWRLLDGNGTPRESFDLAPDDAAFRKLLHGSRPNSLRERFQDFLQRCLLARAPLARPKDLAFFLASYARDALALMADQAALSTLRPLRDAMESALGLTFDASKDGEHLFRSTLVQTLFYGLFSAWAAHARGPNAARPFDWRSADYDLHLPVVRLLYSQVRDPAALGPLGLTPLLDAAQTSLARVDKNAFFSAFDEAQAIQHFYEPFLQFFDPLLRKELGVWYTPPEIVQYMVERVDRVLRQELGRAEGLADESVWVLDPCCGTGSYPLEVLRRIKKTLDKQGLGDLAAEKLKQAATTRVVGFEIMTAPLVIAHWQMGEYLRREGAPLNGEERAAIYLTNALTGWEHNAPQPALVGFEALLKERTEATAVKRNRPILVVIGNPPYNAFAGTSPASEGGLVEPYKDGLQSRWGVRKFNLDDLYIRFWRIAERRVAQGTGEGIVCFISNYSWLNGQSFVQMRESLLANFDRGWFENMHGDRKITEYGPDGRSSETIFAVEGLSVGIRQGVAISLLARTGQQSEGRYLFRDDINDSRAADRRARLMQTLESDAASFEENYVSLQPAENNRFVLRPGRAQAAYETWPDLPAVAAVPAITGLKENRGFVMIQPNKDDVARDMRAYFDRGISFEELKLTQHKLTLDAARFDAKKAREKALEQADFQEQRLRRYILRPFELQWCYWSEIRPLWNEPRPSLVQHHHPGNAFFVSRPNPVTEPEGYATIMVSSLADFHLMRGQAHHFPVNLHEAATSEFLTPNSLLQADANWASSPNLSTQARHWLNEIGLDTSPETSRLVWHHALAITYSPAYLTENAAGIRQGWPRIPLPGDADLLRASAALGERLAALLDPEANVPGLGQGLLSSIAIPSTAPGTTRDWRLNGWGSRTDKGVTMPGRGKTDLRPYAATEAAAQEQAALLGAQTRDIWMNGASFWKNIPEAVWETHIGGYQVLKKWLSYRDHSIIARPLTQEEVAHIQATARRLAAILLMGPDLDANYRASAEAHVPLPAA
jgi:hypothetical protein